MSSQEQAEKEKLLLQRMKLELATGSHTLQDLRRHADLAHRRLEAEDSAALKKVGANMKEAEEEVGDIVIGDVTNVQGPSELSKFAGRALLAAAIGGPLAYLGGKLLDQPPQINIPEMKDTDTDTANGYRIFRPDGN